MKTIKYIQYIKIQSILLTTDMRDKVKGMGMSCS